MTSLIETTVESQAIAAIDRIEQAITQAETPIELLDAKDAATNASVYARMIGLQEQGMRLQNLVLDAEYKIAEIVPRYQHKKSSPIGEDFNLSWQALSQMRKTYEGLGRDTFAALKASAVERGERCRGLLSGATRKG